MYQHARTLGLALSAALVMATAIPAGATSVVPVNLAEINDDTTRGFVGKVTASEVVQLGPESWGERITAEVTEPIKNVTAGETVQWTQYRLGKDTRLAGMPEYITGQNYVLFLNSPVGTSPYSAPVALGQGVFTISTDKSGNVRARNASNNTFVYSGVDLPKLAKAAAASRSTVKLAGKTAGEQTELATLVAHAKALATTPKGQKSLNSFGGKTARDTSGIMGTAAPQASEKVNP